MARPIIAASQENRDMLLQILLFEKYQNEFRIIDGLNQHPEGMNFDGWLEKILEEA